MRSDPSFLIKSAVEGWVDAAALRKLVQETGAALIWPPFGTTGKAYINQNIKAFNYAARHEPWIILVDLDLDFSCAPALRTTWLPQPSSRMCFRIAVHAIESWLLADRDAIAKFLAIEVSRVPLMPDSLPNPKRTMVELARRSQHRDIVRDMVPRDSSGRKEGSGYPSRLIDFIEDQWNPDIAATSSDSLRRCRLRLRELAQGG